MDERGLWELFRRTGLPEVWLALAGEREEQKEELAMTAFRPKIEKA